MSTMNETINNLYALFDAAWEENMNGRGTDITRMVTTFVPDAIQNLQAFIEMFDSKERAYDHTWDMYVDEFEDVENPENKYCSFCEHSIPAIGADGNEILVCFKRKGHEGKEIIIYEDECCGNYST